MKKFLLVLAGIILMTSAALAASGVKRVAVLPFAANSSENLGYIQAGVTDMLISRIAAAGKIEVLSRHDVEAALEKTAMKDLTVSSASQVGKKLKVDYVIWGTITKLGPGVSVDGRILDTAVDKPPIYIFTQSQTMDDIIPQVTKLAGSAASYILEGKEPAGAVAAGALPGQAAAPAVQGSAVAQPPKSKSASFLEAIETDWIVMPPPVSERKGFSISEETPVELIGMAVGDVTGDGRNKIVAIDKQNVRIYREENGEFKLLHKAGGRSYDRYLAVDIADIKGTGVPQIFVTGINRGIPESFVLEYKGGTFVKTDTKLPWLLRVQEIQGKSVLTGQTIGNREAFNTPIFEIVWRNGKFEEGGTVKIPRGLSVYDVLIQSLSGMASSGIIALDELDYLRVFEETDKLVTSLIGLQTPKELLWTSEDQFGGSSNTFDSLQKVLSKTEIVPPATPVNIRMIGCAEAGGDDRKHIVVAKNISTVARVFSNLKVFSSSEVHDFIWTGKALLERGKTKKIKGYIADMQIRDINGDGKPELVLALVTNPGSLARTKSVIVAYTLNP